MTKSKKPRALLLVLALVAAVLTLLFALTPQTTVYADGDYRFEILNYEVVYDINADRTMHVCENIEVKYLGKDSTGIIRDIPVNAGDRVKNVDVKLNKNGVLCDYPYDVEMSKSESLEDFVSLYITDGVRKQFETQMLHIEYDYEITQPRNQNAVFLNPVGFGWDATIAVAEVTLKLPDGFTRADYFIGDTRAPSNDAYAYDPVQNTITATAYNLATYNGLTFDLYFEEGALSTRFDFTPYVIIIIACAALAVLLAVKFLRFNERPLSPVVNFTPPDGMDPLAMGKLIDNSVNAEDVTSLIYYWANKGYLRINLENEDDPMLIRIWKRLPDSAPDYQVVCFNSLFARGDEVRVSSLTGSFYRTVERVKGSVNARHGQLYKKTSIAVSLLFALLGGLLFALPPIILAAVNVSPKLIYYYSLIALIPALVVWGMRVSSYYYRMKYKTAKRTLALAGIIAVAVVCTLLYALLIPDAVMEFVPKLLASGLGYTIIMISPTVIYRTEKYTAQLNQIVGFRNFILYAEKDRLEALLADNPQAYYDILPYAQVLGVSDIWEHKFDGLTVEPPQWMISPVRGYFSFVVLNRAIRASTASMKQHMNSRPASSGASGRGGRFGGGSFGGFGGGGHGGGGGRGI